MDLQDIHVIFAVCTKVFASAQRLKDHQCSETVSCLQCRLQFSSQKRLANHKCRYCTTCCL